MHLRRRRRRRLLIALALLLPLAGAALLHFRYHPLIRELAAVKIDNEASSVIVRAIDQQIERGELQYENLIRIRTDANGHVTALTTDMAEINRLKMELLHSIGEQIEDLSEASLRIPVGDVVAPTLFSGQGGYLSVRLVEYQTSGAEFVSSFSQAGINQTLHRISLKVGIRVTALTPAGLLTVPVSVEMVVAQTVIVGEIPQTLITLPAA